MIDDATLKGCKTTAEVSEMFQAGEFEAVYDTIQRFVELATINRSQIRRALYDYLIPLTSNYVIAPMIGGGDILSWEQEFPNRAHALGQREETWREMLIDRATFRRDGLRSAIEFIRRTLS